MIHYKLIDFVRSTPWAILPSKLSIILEVAQRHAAGEQIDPEQIQTAMAARSANGTGTRQAGAVAVLNISGTLIPHGDALAEMFGAMSCDRIGALYHQALADPAVSGIVLNFDSPGGSVSGVPELASDILKSRGQKPVVAIANHLCASAAYWLATAADELVCTPSSECGSIGVLAAHQDLSGALEQAGVKTTLISAGKYKTEGAPFGPLSEEALADIQGRVDDYYGMFTAAVANGRGVPVSQVRAGFGEGRVVGAKEAVALGMADRIDTLEGVIGSLLKQGIVAGRAKAEADQALVESDVEFRERRARAARGW